jgi:hypothetical protein
MYPSKMVFIPTKGEDYKNNHSLLRHLLKIKKVKPGFQLFQKIKGPGAVP